MSIITLPNIYSNGEVIDAGQLNSNLSTIVNDYNGNITNSNLSSSIVITDSKLAQITSASKVSGTALTGLASIPSGAGVIPSANLTYKNVNFPYVKVSEVQAQNTAAGTATSGSWITRVLNTTDTDTQSISSLGSNQVTLPAGTYITSIKVPFYGGPNACQARLNNITGSAILLISQSTFVSGGPSGNANIVGLFTLSTSSALAVQYQVGTTVSTNGLGAPCNFGNEVYTVAEFTKVL